MYVYMFEFEGLEWVTVAQCGGWYHPVARWQPLVADGQTQKHKLQVIVLPKTEINIYVYISATQKEDNLKHFDHRPPELWREQMTKSRVPKTSSS